ncbi:hypothetical protein QFC21_007348 [Naganishia friedmannii]|uniref:Uncharacterized protein n=1 Tax=Naganishia friedmannii TaxID=89922 RepID=A0ACC2UWT0_9TREE|nr:hypothetical protein QFC21_007348 [Naganishia friedmannii]
MADQAQGSGLRSVAEASLAIVPATSRSGPIVYNYQSPLNSTVHHSIMQCEPASRNVTASITSLPDTEHEHVAGHQALSGVNLMDTFRSLPNHPSYTSGASAPAVSQPKPHHFQPHFPVSKLSAKKAHIIPNSVVVRPKGKICVFGKNEHSRVGSLTSADPDHITNSPSSRTAASDLGFRMASEASASILGRYRCCPRA